MATSVAGGAFFHMNILCVSQCKVAREDDRFSVGIDSDRPTKTGTAHLKQCKRQWRWTEQGWNLIVVGRRQRTWGVDVQM